MAEPLLSEPDFEDMFDGVLTATQTTAVELLLSVASAWILGRKADVDTNAARWVLFEIARDEVLYGAFSRLSDFQNTTAHRTEAGTFDPKAIAFDDLLTDRQKQLLGIDVAACPAGTFGDGNQVAYIDNGAPAHYYYAPGYYYTYPPGY